MFPKNLRGTAWNNKKLKMKELELTGELMSIIIQYKGIFIAVIVLTIGTDMSLDGGIREISETEVDILCNISIQKIKF